MLPKTFEAWSGRDKANALWHCLCKTLQNKVMVKMQDELRCSSSAEVTKALKIFRSVEGGKEVGRSSELHDLSR